MSEDIFSLSAQEKLSSIFCEMTTPTPSKSINEDRTELTDRTERRQAGQAGVQSWSRGDIFPVILIVKGINDSARIVASYGNWKGEEHYVKGDFNTAHAKATAEARQFLEDNKL
jgi:hypothetical protein